MYDQRIISGLMITVVDVRVSPRPEGVLRSFGILITLLCCYCWLQIRTTLNGVP